MTVVCSPGRASEALLWDRIKSAGTKPQQGLRSWLTGGLSPALNPGFHGAGSATSDTAAARGLFGVERPTRQSRVVAAPRGVEPWIFRRNIKRPAGGYGRVDTVCSPRSIRLHASHGMAATHRRRAGSFCRTTQLGSIPPALQSAKRAQRCNAGSHQTGSTHLQRTSLRSSLCQHALRQRVLFAGATRREAPEIRSLRLRALP